MLDEPYLPEAWSSLNNWPTNGSVDGMVVPANEYFVMGDNRNKSQDSRIFGFIGRDRIDGRAWFRIWPLTNFGDIYSKLPTLETGTVFAG
jgi:signal peptidase I